MHSRPWPAAKRRVAVRECTVLQRRACWKCQRRRRGSGWRSLGRSFSCSALSRVSSMAWCADRVVFTFARDEMPVPRRCEPDPALLLPVVSSPSIL